ncbi:MAG: hypothetical protein OJF52_000777 [Nitrospira sp.]|jgi:predicted enzyme related to lactoylglutathione lyase|nr:MAG: hypothetical protein OJF52_000777 [Nitrospira sp.]
MGITKVGAVIWTSSRVQEVIAFYRAVGIPLEPDTHDEHDKVPHYETDIGGAHFAVFQARENASGSGTQIAFAVADLSEVLSAIEKLKAPISTPLEDTPWGKRVVVLDPDGRAVEIYQTETPSSE